MLCAISVVEAKAELVEVARQVFPADAAVGSPQPGLQVGEDHVAEGEDPRSARSIVPLDDALVANAFASQRAIAVQPVGPERRAAGLDRAADEGSDLAESVAFEYVESRAPVPWAPLHDESHEGLATGRSPAAAVFLIRSAEIRLVGLDASVEQLAWTAMQGGSDLVQQEPGRAVAAQPRVALELKSRDALLVAADEEDREEPNAEGNPGVVEDRPGRERGLVAAAVALREAPCDQRAPVSPRDSPTYGHGGEDKHYRDWKQLSSI